MTTVTNEQIIAALAAAAASCTYSRGQGVFLAMEGENLSEIPDGIFVHRVASGTAKDYGHLTPGVPGFMTRYFCRQFSIGAQTDMRISDVDPAARHRAICNIDESALILA